jgi:hypothetical protein
MFPSKYSGIEQSSDAERRFSLALSQKLHAERAQTSEGGIASGILRFVMEVGMVAEMEGEVVMEFEDEGEGGLSLIWTCLEMRGELEMGPGMRRGGDGMAGRSGLQVWTCWDKNSSVRRSGPTDTNKATTGEPGGRASDTL